MFHPGALPEFVQPLCDGRVKLSLVSDIGRRFMVRVFEPGGIVGLAESLRETAYETTAGAVQRCESLRLLR